MHAEHQRRREGTSPRLNGRGPTWAGVGSVGFLALLGGLVGAFLARGLAGAIVGALLFGVGASVVKLGCGGAHLDRPAMAKRTAIGAVVGLILTCVVGAASACDLRLFLGTMIGA